MCYKRFFLLLFTVLGVAKGLYAVPAYPYPIAMKVKGETVYIHMFGDEHRKWAESDDGYTLIQNEKDQWCYAISDNAGRLVASSFLLAPKQSRSDTLNSFLKKIPCHMKPRQNTVFHTEQHRVGKVVGERRILVILMDFQDQRFVKNNTDFDHLFNQVGYTDDGAQGSVQDYYTSASYGQLKLTSDIYGPYTASHQMKYYGGNSVSGGDTNPYALFVEAIEQVVKETDLKIYDADGDGFLDNVHIIYAGYGEEAGGPASAIWAHEMTFSSQPYSVGGVKIDRYSCAPELREATGSGISRIGPHCHEIGHALGAMDYYDTDYNTNGSYLGTGAWDVMASGSWNNKGTTPADFNPYVKAKNYGWITPKAMPSGTVKISPSNTDAENYYQLAASNNGDYYLLENRDGTGWGKYLPGRGLLIYHIHADLANSRNKINATAPQKCYIVCASSSSSRPSNTPASYGDIDSAGCPYPGQTNNTYFGSSSIPQAFFWDSDKCGIELRNITMTGYGDITLNNASTESGYVPIETEGLFLEDFEKGKDYHILDNGGKWTIVENPTDQTGFIDCPIAYNGQKCLQLSAKGVFFSVTKSVIEFDAPLSKTEGHLHILLYYTSTGLRKNANTLRIGYLRDEGDDWIYTEVKSSVNTVWSSFGLDIPYAQISKFRIEGTAVPNSILAIDNIEVEQEITTGQELLQVDLNPMSIYSPSGFLRHHLSRGLNIIRLSDGNIRKILVK